MISKLQWLHFAKQPAHASVYYCTVSQYPIQHMVEPCTTWCDTITIVLLENMPIIQRRSLTDMLCQLTRQTLLV